MECPISKQIIKFVVEITTCGHCFDKASLFEYIVINEYKNGCPICRTPFTRDNIYHSRALQEFITPTKEVSTQTENEDDKKDNDYYRIVDLNEGLINPQSKSILDNQTVKAFNHAFVGVNIPNNFVINRYCYQSSNGDVQTVAQQLARNGYYVYDLFRLSQRGDLINYMLYSNPKMRNGMNTILSRYRRISARLQLPELD